MVIKLGHAGVPTQAFTFSFERFAELVKQRSGGAITVQVFPGNQLGTDRDTQEQVRNGTIQICNTSIVLLSDIPGWGPIGVLAMPYLVKGNSEEEVYRNLMKLTHDPIFKELNDKAGRESGIRVADFGWWFGERQLTTKSKPVIKPEDMKGLKLRTMDTPLVKAGLIALGASATPMDISEVYLALQMGIVDGQENPVGNIYARKFYEVQKYLSLTGHMADLTLPIINEKFYRGLQPEVRELFDKAFADAGAYNNEITLKANSKGIQDLKDKGMVVISVNRAEFAERTKDTWKQFEPKFGVGFYEKVKAIADRM
jgi:tripartite ATP-independent transporter DctP family solute receptor